jgi:hypothetical protein
MNIVITLIFSTFALFVVAQDSQKEWRYLVKREYTGKDLPVNIKSGWLALTVVKDLWHLEQTTIRQEFQYEHDANGKQKNKVLSVEIKSADFEAFVFFRLDGLSVGKVDTPNIKFRDLDPNVSRTLGRETKIINMPFKGKLYSIEVTGSGTFFKRDGVKMLLPYPWSGSSNSNNRLFVKWAGDLDRDGALDLLITYQEGGSGATCLYLSKDAGPDQLVREVFCERR